MEGFEQYLENGAGANLPDLNPPAAAQEGQQAADIAAQTDNTNQPPPVTSEPARTDEPAAVEAQAAAAEPVANPDHDKSLEEISGGRVKGKGDLESIITRAQRADELEQKFKDWNAKYGENPYADSFEETRNLLKKQGATETQLKQLEEITNLGSLSDLSPLDIKVKAMVLRDGVRPEVAERIIKEEAGLTDFLDDDAKEVAETKLRLSSKGDLQYLQDFKEKLTPVDNSTVALQREAAVTQAKEALKPISEQFKTAFTEVKDFNITGSKKPEDAINFTFKTPPEFLDAIPQLTENYIIGTGKAVTAESIGEAKDYIENLMWAKYGKDYLTTAVNHAVSATREAIVKKYENNQPFGSETRHAAPTTDEDAFYREVAR